MANADGGIYVIMDDPAAGSIGLLKLQDSGRPPSTPACNTCADVRDDYMIANNLYCETWTWAYTNRCNSYGPWQAAQTCQLSCFANGNGYVAVRANGSDLP